MVLGHSADGASETQNRKHRSRSAFYEASFGFFFQFSLPLSRDEPAWQVSLQKGFGVLHMTTLSRLGRGLQAFVLDVKRGVWDWFL